MRAKVNEKLQPLYEAGFVLAVVTRAFIKAHGCGLFCAGEEHDFVAVALDCDGFCEVHHGMPQATLAVVRVGDDVFNQGVRALIVGEVRHDEQHAGADELAVLLCDDDVVVWVGDDFCPKRFGRFIGDGIVVEVGVELQKGGQVMCLCEANHEKITPSSPLTTSPMM